MARFRLLLLALAISLPMAACDSTENPADDGEIEIPKRTIVYEIFGTYRRCAIEYRAADGTDRVLPEEPLDWEDSVKVEVNREFLARVSATCADLEREGKATIRLFVDGVLLSSDDVMGYGDSGTAQRLLLPVG